jgi:uncharacterized repeat protein (TIGR01451 family)
MKWLSHNSLRIFALASLSTAVLPALAADSLSLKNQAFQDISVVNKDGKPEIKRQVVTKATPGTEIIYVITYQNTGKKPAEKVVINNPIPTGLAYRPGTAEGAGTSAEVSVDGGKVYGALETLQVKDVDGALRAAKGEDVTHVRWMVVTPVAPGRQGDVTYRAMLK